eukprot:COSAG04_NODE_3182_length_3111_cov_3.934987_1_plen_170_part_00
MGTAHRASGGRGWRGGGSPSHHHIALQIIDPLINEGLTVLVMGRWQGLVARREVWVRALLPALLAAHQRKSSVHQKFLSLLITTLEKVHFGEAGRADQTELDGPPPPAPTLDRSAVTVTGPIKFNLNSIKKFQFKFDLNSSVLTDDLELLDARTVVGHGTTFGTVLNFD